MRITGGALRGRKVGTIRGKAIRPTADRVRESLFSVLGEAFAGRDFLDLFSGTGCVGIEALSRGAARSIFCEKDPAALRLIRANLRALGLLERAVIRRGELPASLSRLNSERPDIAVTYVDPPYGSTQYGEVFHKLVARRLAEPGALIVVEHSVKKALEFQVEPVVQTDVRRYGDAGLSFFRVIEPT